MKNRIMWTCVALLGVASVGCGGDPAPTDAGTPGMDAGASCTPNGPPALADAGAVPSMVTCPTPDGGTAGTGPCCYRVSQGSTLANPELRLRYLDIREPAGSPLTSTLLLGVLNDALDRETFNWLFRVEGADADGPVTIVTGFGLSNGDGTYAFPTGAGGGMTLDQERYRPLMVAGSLTGESVRSERYDGELTVPVLNTDGTAIQLELVLRNLQILDGTFNTERSCVGWSSSRGRFATGVLLDAFIEVETARTGVISSGPVNTTVCAAVAGSVSNPMYCDQPQSAWATPPDALCDAAGCTANADCEDDVCSRLGDATAGLPACNAWHLVAGFAAQGVSITN